MSLTFAQQLDAVEQAVERFPDEFGLRNFPEKRFCISKAASYYASHEVMLYTYVWDEQLNQWMAFAKGTEQELRREIVALNNKED
jgi:hypothetical protein